MTGGPLSDRYARQRAFAPVGEPGQRRLLASRAVIVGAGAVGASLAEQLARSGVGSLRVIDRDVLEASNLGRQVLYTDEDAARRLPKAIALAAHVGALNPDVAVEPVVADFGPRNAASLLDGCDLVLDGTDNLEARYVLNDFCVQSGRTWIYAGCVGSRGLTAVIAPGRTPCLKCVYPEPPAAGVLETCETSGVIAPIAALVASLAAAEAIKILVGADRDVRLSWVSVDLWPFRIAEIGGAASRPRADCPCCGLRTFPHLRVADGPLAATLCGRDAVHVSPGAAAAVDLDALTQRLAGLVPVRRHDYVLVASLGSQEITVFADGRALVKGTSDPALARSLYHRYIGG